VPSTEQKLAYYATPFKSQKKKRPIQRVFVVFFHPSTSVTAMGGAEKRFVETLKFFCKRKNLEITVLESAPSILARPEITCKKYLLPSSFHGKGWLSTYIGWILWAARASIKSFSLARHMRPNAIFVPNNTLPNLFSGYAISFVLRLPVLVVVHHIDIPFIKAGESKGYSLYSCYRSIKYSRLVSLVKTFASYIMLSLLKKAKGIIAVSNFTATALKNNGVSTVKIFVSGNAVDVNFINNIKSYTNKKIYDGVFVGRIAKEKGIFDLLEVWKNIVKSRKNAKLLIIGSGLELASLKEKIATAGLESNVLIQGQCNDKELYSLLKSSKIFIFPSLFEGWGIAVAEALACGIPVVAYDIPALREVFGLCKSVFLVPVGDFDRITQTVLRVLSFENEKLYEISTEYAKNFEWNKVAMTDLKAITKIGAENFQQKMC